MTKKVLISLNDIEYISKCLLNRYGSDVSDWLERWFYDQKDINEILGEAREEFLASRGVK